MKPKDNGKKLLMRCWNVDSGTGIEKVFQCRNVGNWYKVRRKTMKYPLKIRG
jgi:hypothetical protein